MIQHLKKRCLRFLLWEADQTEQYSQLELSDIIEARVEEILMFVQDEVRKLE